MSDATKQTIPVIEASAAISPAAAAFLASLADGGWSMTSVRTYRQDLQALWVEIERRGLALPSLTDAVWAEVAAPVAEAYPVKRRRMALNRLERFRDHLIAHEDAPDRVPPPPDPSPRAVLRRAYESYLRDQRALAKTTTASCLRFYDLFFTYCFGEGLGDLDGIEPDDVVGFVRAYRSPGRAPRDRTAPSALRNLFRFLFWSGHTRTDLGRGLPKTRQPKPTAIPRYLPPEDVQRLIDAAADHPITGRRNRAILLTVARLGLRAPELVAIELGDIDWRRGELLVRGKGGLHDRMPLTVKVGEAIVDYLRHERRGTDRRLFVSSRPPYRRFGDGQIVRLILNAAYDRTCLRPPRRGLGTHVLRHSLATDLLRRGASIEEVGDVLRHRSSMNTTIYAQHDLDALRGLAPPWPDAPALAGEDAR
jgi:site-specific recombinase XerD